MRGHQLHRGRPQRLPVRGNERPRPSHPLHTDRKSKCTLPRRSREATRKNTRRRRTRERRSVRRTSRPPPPTRSVLRKFVPRADARRSIRGRGYTETLRRDRSIRSADRGRGRVRRGRRRRWERARRRWVPRRRGEGIRALS